MPCPEWKLRPLFKMTMVLGIRCTISVGRETVVRASPGGAARRGDPYKIGHAWPFPLVMHAAQHERSLPWLGRLEEKFSVVELCYIIVM